MLLKRYLLVLLPVVFIQSFAHAAIFNVNSTSDSTDSTPGDGVCATASTVCTLRAAIVEANALAGADSIIVPAGTYVTGSSLTITSEIAITGAGSATTIVDANDTARVFFVSTNQAVSMADFSIQGGNAGGSGLGGGVYLNSNGNLTLSGMNVSNNSANSGAGIGFGSPINQLIVNNSMIENNTGITGGVGPSSSDGGGLYTSTGTVVITDSTIRDNTADFGGGIYSVGTVLTLRNTTVSGNMATAPSNINSGVGGGGLHIGSGSSATMLAINSTISSNKALNTAAGLLVENGTVSLFNTTVTNNIADYDNDGTGSAGGVRTSSQGFLNITNSIIAGNLANTGTSPDCAAGNITSSGYNIIGNNVGCNIIAATGDLIGTNATPFDPGLGALANNGGPTQTHQLLNGSPAIDGGNPSGCTDNLGAELTTDQRGEARPVDGGAGSAICDIGAFETDPLPVADAGSDQVVAFGEAVSLDGSASAAFAGITAYSWVQTPASTVTINNGNTATAGFTAPAASGVLTFELTITDTSGLTDSDTVVVTVNADPVANAGPDETVNELQSVSLDGTGSADSDGSIASYSWTQTAGTAVTINNANTESPGFTAPTGAGVLTFELTVTDNHGFTDTDTVSITINAVPVANAGTDQTVNGGDAVTLDGTASADADGSLQSFAWTQTAGTAVILSNTDTATSGFTAPASAGTLEFLLTVTDNNGATDQDTVIITVNQTQTGSGTGTGSDPGSSGGCSVNPRAQFDPLLPLLLTLALFHLWRRRTRVV